MKSRLFPPKKCNYCPSGDIPSGQLFCRICGRNRYFNAKKWEILGAVVALITVTSICVGGVVVLIPPLFKQDTINEFTSTPYSFTLTDTNLPLPTAQFTPTPVVLRPTSTIPQQQIPSPTLTPPLLSISSLNIVQIREIGKWNTNTYFDELVFSPNGRLLAGAGHNSEVVMWFFPDGEIAWVLQRHSRPLDNDIDGSSDSRVRSVSFSPDGKYLVSGANDNKVMFWDVNNRTYIGWINSHERDVMSVRFSPVLPYVTASGSKDAQLLITDADNDFETSTPFRLSGLKNHIYALSFSPTGEYLAGGGKDGVVIWKTSTWEPVIWMSDFVPNKLAFSPNGSVLVGCGDSGVIIWNANSGGIIKKIKETQSVHSISFSPDGSVLAAGLEGGIIKFYSTDSWTEIYSLTTPEPVRSLAFSPDGLYLISSSKENLIRLWMINP